MLRDTAVARVKQMLGFKQNLDSEIVQAMIESQEDLERSSELPFFLRKNYSGLVTVALDNQVAVPTDFIRESDDDQMAITDSEGGEHNVVKDLRGYLRIRYPGTEDPSIPQRYARMYRTFFFYPTPDAIYTLNGTYYGKDQTLSTNIENLWLKELPFILVARAGLLLGAGLRDKEGLAAFGYMNDVNTEKLHRMSTADDQAGSKPVIGGED